MSSRLHTELHGRSALERLRDLPAVGDVVPPLVLRRLWPRRGDHALLEYVAAEGEGPPVAGQWLGGDRRAAAHAAAMAAASGPGAGVVVPGRGVVLHRRGSDHHLPALRDALDRPGATLVVHRPGRRAVVRLDGAERRWIKLVRPGRLRPLLVAVRHVAPLVPQVPLLVGASDRRGVTMWRDMAGAPLADLIATADPRPAVLATGQLVHRLHAVPPPARVHGASDEVALLHRWMGHLRWWDPDTSEVVAPLVGPTGDALTSRSPRGGAVTVHRDLHDGQVLVSPGGTGVLDPDTLAAGERELDLGNLIAHLRLAAHQGRCTPHVADEMSQVLLEGYGSTFVDGERLEAYTRAALLRLVAVHALRPVSRSAVAGLLADLGVA